MSIGLHGYLSQPLTISAGTHRPSQQAKKTAFQTVLPVISFSDQTYSKSALFGQERVCLHGDPLESEREQTPYCTISFCDFCS